MAQPLKWLVVDREGQPVGLAQKRPGFMHFVAQPGMTWPESLARDAVATFAGASDNGPYTVRPAE